MTTRKYRQWLRLTIYILIVATTVYLPRNLGWSQPLEMYFYDRLIRLRPSEPVDEKIVIVGLTEQDIEKLAELPVADSILAKLIDNIKQHDPRVIGLDLHRNVDTGSGYQQLKSVIQSTPNLVGIEKTSQGNFDFPAIPPNPEIAQNGMSSASDLIVDSGDIVRRGYLYVSKSDLTTEQLPSFSLKMALKYLAEEGINPTSSGGKEHYLKLGKAVLTRLKSNREFYQQSDIDNHQIIINFRSADKPFKTVSFSDVLDNQIEPSLLKNKLVFIGASASTLGDNFFTPKSRKTLDFEDEMFGVEIHAHQTSQIINAALSNRKLIKLLSSPIESFWVLAWIIAPSTLLVSRVNLNTNLSNLWFNYISINLLAFSSIILIAYILLLTGYWIPVANPTIALASSFIIGYGYAEVTKEKQLASLLSIKLKEKTKELSKAQKRLIAREKLVAYEKLSVKMAHEIRNYLNAINMANDNCQYKLKHLDLFISENFFLFEDIADSESPKHLTSYYSRKFNKTSKNINKISLIVESILAESNPDCKQVCLTDANEIIKTVVKETDWIESKKNGVLNLSISLKLTLELPKINIASVELERVIANLLDNAGDSLYQKTLVDAQHSSVINISTNYNDSAIEIRIVDNGIGIASDNLKHIFTPFWTTKKSVDGVGVGLFFSQQKIEKYNGNVTVTSDEGKWTEFTIVLPLR